MVTATLDPEFLKAFRSGTLTEELADAFLHRDPHELRLLLIQLSLTISRKNKPGPHQPSSTVPTYEKPTKKKRKSKTGAKPGHEGHSRRTPEVIDRKQDHRLPQCPCCGGTLHRTQRKRTRIIEDIAEDTQFETTEHTIYRDWCPTCKKQVEPIVPDALPNNTIGHRTVVLTAWLHYGLGTTASQILEIVNGHLQMPLSEGGLIDNWHRLSDILFPWYEEIRLDCLDSPVLHADETGWRVCGDSWWLWCAGTKRSTYYWIDDNRGHKALNEFFTVEFEGILVTDFWKAYNAFAPNQQKCWAHLLRDVKEIDTGPDPGDDWRSFSKKLKRLFGDGVRLKLAREGLSAEVFDLRLSYLHGRLGELSRYEGECPYVVRFAKRLARECDSLLMFVEFVDVEPTNNFAEREIRPAVQMRKNSYGCMSEAGSVTRSILMSIYRTLKQRGLDPLKVVEEALRIFVTEHRLPPIPEPASSGD